MRSASIGASSPEPLPRTATSCAMSGITNISCASSSDTTMPLLSTSSTGELTMPMTVTRSLAMEPSAA